MKQMLEQIKETSILAGNAIMEIYNTDFHVETKSDDSPLTMADKAANKIIIEVLKKTYPEYAILSEEEKDDLTRRDNEFCFIVDPLDGTKEFVKKNGEFTVNIALAQHQEVVLGVIYVPVARQIYYAAKGIGAFFEDLITGEKKKMSVSDKLDDLIWVGSKSHSSEKEAMIIAQHQEVIETIVSAGSSLKGCMVANAQADIYYRFGFTCEWDTAAMQCIVEQAGGIFRQMDHSKMLYNRENTLNDKGFYIVNRKENIWI